METEGKKAIVFELADSVLRSWWTLVAGVCFGLAGATLALHYIPKHFQAKTELLIIPQSIPIEFVRSTVTEDMTRRVAALGEYVFDESNMVDLVTRYIGAPVGEEHKSAMIASVRSRIDVGFDPRSGILSLAYTDLEPRRAAELTNDLASLYIKESSRFRREQVHDTKENIKARTDEYKNELDLKQQELNQFLQRHYAETAGSYEANMRQLETRQNDLHLNRIRQQELQDELPILEARLRDAPGTDRVLVGVEDPLVQQLRQLEAQLEQLLIDYQEAHPKVQKKMREVADLEQRIQQSPVQTTPGVPRATSPLEAQYLSLQSQLTKLVSDEAKFRADIARLNRRIAATPKVQTELEQLTAERDLLSAKYVEFQTKLETAEDAQTLEDSETAQQIKVVKTARAPNKAIKPQPKQVYMAGLALGLLLFVGPLPARRLLNPLIASEAGMKSLSAVPLLVCIPRIITIEAKGFAFRRLAKNLSLSVLSTTVLAVVYYFFVGVGG